MNSRLSDRRLIAPPIAPVPAGTPRPLWSVMIPTFNCAEYLRLTLQSVLAQAFSPDRMQIEVVDDCSTKGDPEAVVYEVGQGRVQFHRKPHNGGAVPNFNTCIERSRGQLVHILHGDDLVGPEFYQHFASRFEKHPHCAGVFSRALVVDEYGGLDELTPRIRSLEAPSDNPQELLMSDPIRTPAAVIRRSFYESHGGFMPHLVHTADWEMWVRVIRLGTAVMINEPLATYRMFSVNDTSRLRRTAGNLRDYIQLADCFASAGIDGFDRKQFLRGVGKAALRQAQSFRRQGDDLAFRANLDLWKELIPATDRIWIVVRDHLRQVRRTIRRSGTDKTRSDEFPGG